MGPFGNAIQPSRRQRKRLARPLNHTNEGGKFHSSFSLKKQPVINTKSFVIHSDCFKKIFLQYNFYIHFRNYLMGLLSLYLHWKCELSKITDYKHTYRL